MSWARAESGLSFITLVTLFLKQQKVLHQQISLEHYNDLGKLLFGFTIFWGYIAFCQYMLIWYSSIPEETVWFFHRWQASWKTVTILLIIGHFFLPFLVLLGRDPKRNLKVLTFIGCWVLVIHWIDLYWMVMPNLHTHGVHFSWIDLATLFAVTSLVLWRFFARLDRKPLIPVKDPRLADSLRFENV
jgi:hypothetical protein